ncbi:SDR family NAD(P)-dependent oxidoreductase [Pseudoalteromonas sp. S16_S37]|uniref:SDR family NAD(P)-dependent oxidoreductase n=1 Tax=Pseudoalteromonas sp. S16_S37 TaxID=2720228 RepID=UPI001681851A|nr:SDR family NAD(P)-dependent oxidoreductase [Pseudoalteromonas sp. S16_S37]MBD1582556.1 SDR family NAD(P)-dependent oxidoreductase [Pseudoalteromonas sp. S16_S37]
MVQKINPTIIITGASKGVGAASAHAYANAYPDGVNLVLVARNLAPLENMQSQLARYAQCQVLLIQADVASLSDCERIVAQAVEQFGSINVLVNNVGLHYRGDFSKLSAQHVAAMVDVNMRAPMVLSALAIKHMPSTEHNAIVMVGSLAGLTPLQGAATYSGTKSGLRAFTYALHDELATSKINVAVVSPGPIDTGFIMDEIDQVEDIVYSQPMSSAEQVADAIVLLSQSTRTEIAMPSASGKLATFSYLFPSFRRAVRGLLYRIGAKNKEKYRRTNNQDE